MSPEKTFFFTILGAQGLGLLFVFVILPLYDRVMKMWTSRVVA